MDHRIPAGSQNGQLFSPRPLMGGGVNIRYIQGLLRHKDIKTTLIYIHVSTDKATAVESPLDRLPIGGNKTE